MTIPFDPNIYPGTGPTIFPPGQVTFGDPTPKDPFQSHKPKNIPTLRAVEVTGYNLVSLVAYILREGDQDVYVPAERDSITVDNKRFHLNEWIVHEKVEDSLGGWKKARFRHATEEETQEFGLG